MRERALARAPLALAAAALAGALLGPGLAAPAAAEDVDLVGSWYVLVHYKDDAAPNPKLERWQDEEWVFARKGRRLQWTVYPIVVFDDESGRFERRSTGQYARILAYWEPNDAQLKDIRDGLQVNPRGSKEKSLRGSDEDGWSSSRRTSVASASVVTYQEVWTIDGLPSRPVFSRSDFLGGGRTDSLEGITKYTTEKIENGVLSGSFTRDEHRHGTFTMMRSGGVEALKGAKNQHELQAKAARRAIEQSPTAHAEAARLIQQQLEQAGLSLPDEEMKRLADEGVVLFGQGVPEKEIEARLAERVRQQLTGFAPSGARHDDATRYRWPFVSKVPRQLLQGVRGDAESQAKGKLFLGFRRRDLLRHAFDFDLPVGTPVVAARAGKVARVIDGHTEGGPQQGMVLRSNSVVVLHDDGTWALYRHLAPGIEVKVGQHVEAGDVLGKSGDTGQLLQPELLFAVQRVDAEGAIRSVDIRFDDGSADGLVPVIGAYYGGE